MPKNHTAFQAEMHKNIARFKVCKGYTSKAAEKLRQILEEHKSRRSADE